MASASFDQLFWPWSITGDLQRDNIRWVADLESTVDAEIIQSSIHTIFPLQPSTCDSLYCLDGAVFFLCRFGAFLLYFILQTIQKCNIIFAIYLSTFFLLNKKIPLSGLLTRLRLEVVVTYRIIKS